MEHDYKVGDKVIIVDAGGDEASTVGDILTIVRVSKIKNYPTFYYFKEVGYGLCQHRLEPYKELVDLSNKKINVMCYADEQGISLEQAHKEIQTWLFENGCRWNDGAVTLDSGTKDCPYGFLYIDDLTFTKSDHNAYKYYKAQTGYQEITFMAERSVKLTPTLVEPPVETIELNGKKYNKSELEKALQHIKPLA